MLFSKSKSLVNVEIEVSIEDRAERLVEEFENFSSWEERYKHLIAKGKSLVQMPKEYEVEENKVRGCQSQVWLYASMNKEKEMELFANSDAAIVKGIVALLVEVYNKSTPEEVMSFEPSFIQEIGLKQHLSMSRANGLASMIKQIKIYGYAFHTKMKMGLPL